MGNTYGYVRVSSRDQNEDRQIDAMNQLKIAPKNIYMDKQSGKDFNRPSFQRMIADIEAGKVGCVVTKDLLRLGRNYIEAGSYIEIFFPKHNVRYIAVTDGVDSLTRQEMDITPFKNILKNISCLGRVFC